MPTTLAHIGIQGPLTRTLLRGSDVKWILAACVLPDLPWIARRVVLELPFDLPLLHFQAYFFVQASLFMGLILAGALAALSRWPRRTFAILALGVVMHLLLDSLEDKFGNGVHLLAPFDWHLFSLRLVRPDGAVTLIGAALGFSYWVYAWRRIQPQPPDALPGLRRWLTAGGLAGLWLVLPALMIPGPFSTDTHSIRTFLEKDKRVGRPVTFDRRPVEHRADGTYIRSPVGEPIRVIGADLAGIEQASIRGRFTATDTVEARQVRVHRPGVRDIPVIVGLACVLLWWLREAAAMGLWPHLVRQRAATD